MYNRIFVSNVQRLLDEKGLTRNRLSTLADISPSFLGDLTQGKANPSLRIMEAIADALQTPLPMLLIPHDCDAWEDINALLKDDAKMKPKPPPHGYERVAAILPEHQSFVVKKWDAEARKKLRSGRATGK